MDQDHVLEKRLFSYTLSRKGHTYLVHIQGHIQGHIQVHIQVHTPELRQVTPKGQKQGLILGQAQGQTWVHRRVNQRQGFHPPELVLQQSKGQERGMELDLMGPSMGHHSGVQVQLGDCDLEWVLGVVPMWGGDQLHDHLVESTGVRRGD
jgi:hypothetical protein